MGRLSVKEDSQAAEAVAETIALKGLGIQKQSAATDKRYHFIGAGGVGVSGLIGIMTRNGAIASGSDQQEGPVIEALSRSGVDITIGHNADNIHDDLDGVVISAAIKESNPELIAARKKQIPIYKYAEMLGDIMSEYEEGVAIAGTHGKSTTSGWLSFVLKEAGLEPNFIVGADISQLGSSSGLGDSRIFVAEACEYDRSFLNLRPKIGVILNIEQDHLDYYRDEEEIVEAFTCFADGIRKDGVLIADGRDRNVGKVIANLAGGKKVVTFGFGTVCDFSAQNMEICEGTCCFDVYRGGKFAGKARIQLPGEHNVRNALAVIACATEAGLKTAEAIELIGEFTGIDRRLMLKSKIGGITVMDDYAHHPTEIRASLRAIRQYYEPRRIICVFQPHQYSRTRFLLDDFAESFRLADITVVPEIYFVRDTEAGKKEVNAQTLVDKILADDSKALFVNGFEGICRYLKENVRTGDLVVTMGAGDIWKVADEYIQWLRENC